MDKAKNQLLITYINYFAYSKWISVTTQELQGV